MEATQQYLVPSLLETSLAWAPVKLVVQLLKLQVSNLTYHNPICFPRFDFLTVFITVFKDFIPCTSGYKV